MSIKLRFVSFACILLVVLLSSCSKQLKTSGPYFGNGFHNGWADQTSVVIWTRLTSNPDGNLEGQKFMVPTGEEHRQLNQEADEEQILKTSLKFVQHTIFTLITTWLK